MEVRGFYAVISEAELLKHCVPKPCSRTPSREATFPHQIAKAELCCIALPSRVAGEKENLSFYAYATSSKRVRFSTSDTNHHQTLDQYYELPLSFREGCLLSSAAF
jgi:hypothetical protein